MPQPYGAYLWQASITPGDGLWPMPGVHWMVALLTASRRGEIYITYSAVPQPFHPHGGAHSIGGLSVTWFLCLPYIVVGSSFPGSAPPNDTDDSKICGGALNLVIIVFWLHIILMNLLAPGWWSTSLVNHTLSHIYPGLTGKESTLIHFPLEPQCEDYSFLDQAVEDFEHGLDSILTDFFQHTRIGCIFWWG